MSENMSDKDIHRQTTVALFGEDADAKRSVAKTINFGLLYGIGNDIELKDKALNDLEIKEIKCK